VSAFIIDEIMIQIGNKHYWLRICIESIRRSVFRIHTSQARNILALSSFLEFLVSKYDRHSVYSDRATATRSMQETGNKTLFAFFRGEEFDRKDYAVL
jgi:transposase-like protein